MVLQVVFDMHIVVHSCSNIPHPGARIYWKWKLPPASRGLSESQEVTVENAVTWNSEVAIPNCVFKLDDETKVLKSSLLRLSIRQETRPTGGMNGYLRLGVVHIDLAEYTGVSEVPVLNMTMLVDLPAWTFTSLSLSLDIVFMVNRSPERTCWSTRD
ncbi:Ras family gtpase, partial [Globisporangium splendens]